MKNSVLPPSLQSEIKTNIPTPREVLQKKLADKIKLAKDKQSKPSQQQLNKLEKQAAKEKKEVDNDPRITFLMKEYFVYALRMYKGVDLPNPHEILENKEKYELSYYNFSIDLLKKNNNNPEVLKNPYCNYMREVLGLNN